VVEAREEPLVVAAGDKLDARRRAPGSGEPFWRLITEATVYRYEEDGRHHEQLRVEASGRERMLRLRIRNRDDRLSSCAGIAVLTPVERLVFGGPAGPHVHAELRQRRPRRARLRHRAHGGRSRDLDRAGQRGAAGRAPTARAEARRESWTERHPALVWSALATLVVRAGHDHVARAAGGGCRRRGLIR
jgi:hypothetical protein